MIDTETETVTAAALSSLQRAITTLKRHEMDSDARQVTRAFVDLARLASRQRKRREAFDRDMDRRHRQMLIGEAEDYLALGIPLSEELRDALLRAPA